MRTTPAGDVFWRQSSDRRRGRRPTHEVGWTPEGGLVLSPEEFWCVLLPPETWFDDCRLSSGSSPVLRFASAVEYTKSCSAKVRSWCHLNTLEVRKFIKIVYFDTFHLKYFYPLPPSSAWASLGLAQGRPSGRRQQKTTAIVIGPKIDTFYLKYFYPPPPSSTWASISKPRGVRVGGRQ